VNALGRASAARIALVDRVAESRSALGSVRHQGAVGRKLHLLRVVGATAVVLVLEAHRGLQPVSRLLDDLFAAFAAVAGQQRVARDGLRLRDLQSKQCGQYSDRIDDARVVHQHAPSLTRALRASINHARRTASPLPSP
jgi:hypothetical protein